MPGHVECCWRSVAEWLGRNLPGVKVNLRSGFWPAWHARWHRDLRGTVSGDETWSARRIAEMNGLNLVE
jgi:putative pyruvate formate lyase activating enzyme